MVVALLALVPLHTPALLAHHSNSAFEVDKIIVVKGVVVIRKSRVAGSSEFDPSARCVPAGMPSMMNMTYESHRIA